MKNTPKKLVKKEVLAYYGRCRYTYIDQDKNSYTVKVYNRYYDRLYDEGNFIYIFKVYINPEPSIENGYSYKCGEEIDRYLVNS